MLTVSLISFREFLESFLIISVFIGISRKIKIKKEVEIFLATITGITLSFLLSTITFIFGERARGVITEKNAELLEGYLMVFSGFFLAYVIFSLHKVIRSGQGETIIKAHNRLQNNSFNLTLFFTIVFLIFREGFEIALFTASTALFSTFIQNMLGLFTGFILATVFGILVYFAYVKFPIGKIYKATEYMIMILGASLVQNGLTELFEYGLGINLNNFLRLPLSFLPNKTTIIGHFIKSFFGIEQDFSLTRLLIMITYLFFIYNLFLRRKTPNLKLR